MSENTWPAVGSNDQLVQLPEAAHHANGPFGLSVVPLYTRAQLLEAIETERHACSIAVWMTLQDALAPDADNKGLEGWMREAEQRVKNRSLNDPDVSRRVREAVAAERERYSPLMQAVEQLLDAGHMDQEHLARLRAAWEAA